MWVVISLNFEVPSSKVKIAVLRYGLMVGGISIVFVCNREMVAVEKVWYKEIENRSSQIPRNIVYYPCTLSCICKL